jgi:Glyoxalase/Bleomycin resistance protein/Dioxygenase superfamily
MQRSTEFYKRLGFSGTLIDFKDYYEPMHPWFSGSPPRQHLRMVMSPNGGWLEPVEHDPPSADMRGEWGHVGAMDFGVGVRDLDLAVERLGAAGVEFLSQPQTIEVDGGVWRYVYVKEPDGNYASLCEARY